MDIKTRRQFQRVVRQFYRSHHRDFPWRKTTNPYRIWISEIMLQQTQTHRVVPKYLAFLKQFPSVRSLASAPLNQVLVSWQGLGYNRRALQAKRTANNIIAQHRGVFPNTYDALRELPGIGNYTAGAIMAFAYNKPALLLETNIRSVFIEYFFSGKQGIDDRELMTLIEQTLDVKNPREWYWALMDYGAHLKKMKHNPSRNSKHYTKQPKFAGSNRQLRGAIIRALSGAPRTTRSLNSLLDFPQERIVATLVDLEHEGFLTKDKGKYRLASQ